MSEKPWQWQDMDTVTGDILFDFMYRRNHSELEPVASELGIKALAIY